MRHAKREGDGATPTGKFRLLHGYYRPDRLARSRTHIPMQTLKEHLGWCDASGHRLYNRPVHLPCDQSHEIMARSDGAYDVVIVLDYNIAPRRQGRGSAIFLHLIREGAAHTEGCIAVSRDTMRKLLPLLGWKTRILIGSNPVPRK